MLGKRYVLSAGRMLRLDDLVCSQLVNIDSQSVTENMTTACTAHCCLSTV